MFVFLNITGIVAKIDVIVTIYRLNSRDYLREKIGQNTPTTSSTASEIPTFATPSKHKFSVRFSLPSRLCCLNWFIIYIEKAASTDPQSFELSSIDQHSSNLKTNRSDSDIYGANIPVGVGSFEQMAGLDDAEMQHTGEKSRRFRHHYQVWLWRP